MAVTYLRSKKLLVLQLGNMLQRCHQDYMYDKAVKWQDGSATWFLCLAEGRDLFLPGFGATLVQPRSDRLGWRGRRWQCCLLTPGTLVWQNRQEKTDQKFCLDTSIGRPTSLLQMPLKHSLHV